MKTHTKSYRPSEQAQTISFHLMPPSARFRLRLWLTETEIKIVNGAPSYEWRASKREKVEKGGKSSAWVRYKVMQLCSSWAPSDCACIKRLIDWCLDIVISIHLGLSLDCTSCWHQAFFLHVQRSSLFCHNGGRVQWDIEQHHHEHQLKCNDMGQINRDKSK